MKKLLIALVILLLILFGWYYFQSRPDCTSSNSQLCETSPTLSLVSEPIPTKIHKLCPPDGLAEDEPIFSRTIDNTTTPGVFKSFGNILNEQGELFSIRVSGRSEKAVKAYTDEVVVCVDYLAGPSTQKAPKEDLANKPGSIMKDVIALNENNLVIEIDLLAVLNENIEIDEAKKYLEDTLNDNVIRVMARNRVVGEFVTPPMLYNFRPVAKQLSVSHNIDFIIDPTVNYGHWHDYRSHCLHWAESTFVIEDGFGSGGVFGALYRSDYYLNSASTHRGWPSRTLGHNSGQFTSTYDFAVNGLANGSKYRISGTWNRAYNAARPNDGGVRCW